MKETRPLGQTVFRPGIPPLVETRQGVGPGTLQCPAFCGCGLSPAIALPPLLRAVSHAPVVLVLEGLQSASTAWSKTSPKETSPQAALGHGNTQVYPPPRAPCKRPIRPNESSAHTSKEGETIANAQYSSSMVPLPRGGCNYCVGFNITKLVCS